MPCLGLQSLFNCLGTGERRAILGDRATICAISLYIWFRGVFALHSFVDHMALAETLLVFTVFLSSILFALLFLLHLLGRVHWRHLIFGVEPNRVALVWPMLKIKFADRSLLLCHLGHTSKHILLDLIQVVGQLWYWGFVLQTGQGCQLGSSLLERWEVIGCWLDQVRGDGSRHRFSFLTSEFAERALKNVFLFGPLNSQRLEIAKRFDLRYFVRALISAQRRRVLMWRMQFQHVLV